MLKNAMNYLGEIAAGGLGHGSNGDETDYSPTSTDHIVGSVVDVGGIQVGRTFCKSTQIATNMSLTGPSPAANRRGRLRVRLRRRAERRRSPDGAEAAAGGRCGEEEADRSGDNLPQEAEAVPQGRDGIGSFLA